MVQETVSRNINWDEGTEAIIKQNLLIGELEYAAQVALKAGRSIEALLIAEAGGQELYDQIKEEYFSLHKDLFVKEIIQAVSKNDFTSIIDQVCGPIAPTYVNWKETLAYIIAYDNDEQLRTVAKNLGDQLLKQKKDINSAIVCYILSRELNTVVDLWKKRALFQIRKQGVDKNEALFHLFQKTILLKTACPQTQSTEDIDLIMADFGEFLNSEQQSFIAMKYLQTSSISCSKAANLKHRIFNSKAQMQQMF
jgi:protein transport protein SEC31